MNGFIVERTRYLEVNEQDNLTPGNWINKKPTKDWYDYKNSKWANIMVEANGKQIYYTWIPRYEFKLTSSQQKQPEQGRTEVRFIDATSTQTGIGYQIPKAFEFDGKQLTGYWAMKYTAGN